MDFLEWNFGKMPVLWHFVDPLSGCSDSVLPIIEASEILAGCQLCQSGGRGQNSAIPVYHCYPTSQITWFQRWFPLEHSWK
jgi:hypothetical protein